MYMYMRIRSGQCANVHAACADKLVISSGTAVMESCDEDQGKQVGNESPE